MGTAEAELISERRAYLAKLQAQRELKERVGRDEAAAAARISELLAEVAAVARLPASRRPPPAAPAHTLSHARAWHHGGDWW